MVYQVCRRSDGSRKFTYLSDTVKVLYGCTPQEAMKDIGRIYGRIHPDDRQRLFEEEEAANRDLTIFRTEARIVTPSGSVRWSTFVSNPRVLPDGSTLWSGIELDITARKEADARLLDYQQRLRALAAQVSSAEERERRRLAADLHDHIGQTLAVAKIKLGRARKEARGSPLAEAVGEVHGMLDRMIQATRSLAFDLSPPLLHELGFPEAVEWLAERFRTGQGLAVAVRNGGFPPGLADDLAGMLFRGVRELLMNAVKHARAGKVEVAIGRADGQVRVEVRDDGAGFDASRPARAGDRSGFGLFNLKERLSHLGGRLEVRSARGKGTCVTMLVPEDGARPDGKGR